MDGLSEQLKNGTEIAIESENNCWISGKPVYVVLRI